MHIIRMLSIVMDLAMEQDLPNFAIRAPYDENSRTVIFLPKVEPLEYEQLRE